jgi:hypothetical protein
MNFFRRTISLPIVVVLCSAALRAAEPERIPVHLTVECDNSVLRNELHSFISRELRSIPDVELFVDPPPTGGLVSFNVGAVTTCSDQVVAVSFGMSQRYYPNPLDPFVDEYLGAGVYTDRRADLKGLAQRLVASFDSSALNQWRRQQEESKRAVQKSRPEAPKKKH